MNHEKAKNSLDCPIPKPNVVHSKLASTLGVEVEVRFLSKTLNQISKHLYQEIQIKHLNQL